MANSRKSPRGPKGPRGQELDTRVTNAIRAELGLAFFEHEKSDAAEFGALRERVDGLVTDFRDYREEDRSWKVELKKSLFGDDGTGGFNGRMSAIETKATWTAGALAGVSGLGALVWAMAKYFGQSITFSR